MPQEANVMVEKLWKKVQEIGLGAASLARLSRRKSWKESVSSRPEGWSVL